MSKTSQNKSTEHQPMTTQASAVLQTKAMPATSLSEFQQIIIDESFVLAKKFVPDSLKNINTIQPNWVIPAEALVTLDSQPETAVSTFFPETPCVCEINHDKPAPPKTHPIQVENELRYAVSEELQDAVKKQSRLAMVDSIVGMSDYETTFADLVEVERKALLILHERFSQYGTNLTVKPPTQPSPTSMGRNRSDKLKKKDAKTNSVFLNAVVAIPGIADARPPLLTGDIVLVRPLRSVSLPVYSKYSPPSWSSPVCAEFRCHVKMVSRAPERVSMMTNKESDAQIPDKAIISWIPQQMQDALRMSYPEGQFNCRFVPSDVHHKACMAALLWLRNFSTSTASELLFPVEAPILPAYVEEKFHGQEYEGLNAKQKSFVKMVCARTMNPSRRISPPMILTGPAGTGKTKVLLFAILEVLKISEDPHILVCTPSHTACDVVTKRLGKHLDSNQLFRLYDANRPVVTVPVEILRFTRQSRDSGSFCLPEGSEMRAFKVIVCTCSDAHILYRFGFTNEHIQKKKECIKAYITQMSKLIGLKSQITGEYIPHFTHLFIDEAAQATEPETLIPFSVVLDNKENSRKTEIALSGDPRQLSPRVYSKEASEAGLGRSFMERLLQRPVHCLGGGYPHLLGPDPHDTPRFGVVNYSIRHGEDEQLSIFLTQNYRGHPAFLMMPSALFYYDKLEAAKEVSQVSSDFAEKLRIVESISEPVSTNDVDSTIPEILKTKKQSTWPIHFLGIIGQDSSVSIESYADSNSWTNIEEANAVVQIVEQLCKVAGVSNQSIGVMAPFRGQVVLIRKLLRLRFLGGINVGTIEDYQSVEHDVIVLSLTRSNIKFVDQDVESRMGVFRQPKTTNVAMTRAEHLFIVVGNPTTMLYDPIWKQWLLFCLRNGLWYGEKGSAFTTMMSSLGSNKLSIISHRPGPSHFLLAVKSDEEENESVVILSTMERENRGLHQ